MRKSSPAKTEKRAINVLESVIDNHKTMDYQFNHTDKEMSWDGFIWLNKENNGVQSKENMEARLPVQIKGHEVFDETVISNTKINYPVDLSDLSLYATEKGVIYFQIFLKAAESKIFYSLLYPSKIADYLELANTKGNKEKITIVFTELEQTPEAIYIIAKQFSDEAKKQGSAYNPLVQDRIRSDEFKDLKEVNISVVGPSDIFDILKRLSVGDICLHGKTDTNDKYFRPLQWTENTTYYSGREVEQNISVGDCVFYKNYRCIIDSNGGVEIIPSPNLCMRITEGKFEFTPKSGLEEMSNDANFLLALYNSDAYWIGDHKFKIENQNISEDFENRLRFISDVYDATHTIGLDEYIDLNHLSDDELKSLITLINLYLGTYNNRFVDVYTRYDWKFGDKYYPLLVNKVGDKLTIDSSIYSKQFAVLLPDDELESVWYRMPLFAYQKPEILANLYLCKFEEFENQILNSDFNSKTTETLSGCSLSMIGAYDICGDERFLKLAQLLLTMIAEVDESEITMLNNLQIKYRQNTLDKKDIEYLNGITSEIPQILFGKSVLLEDLQSANKYFALMPEEEQKAYKEYPIYTLYKKIC